MRLRRYLDAQASTDGKEKRGLVYWTAMLNVVTRWALIGRFYV